MFTDEERGTVRPRNAATVTQLLGGLQGFAPDLQVPDNLKPLLSVCALLEVESKSKVV